MTSITPPWDDTPHRVNDGTFNVGHHLQVIVVLNVVTRDGRDLSIHNHELGMKRAQWRPVKVDNSKIYIRHLFRWWQTNPSCLPSC